MPALTLTSYVPSASGLTGGMITDLEIQDPGDGAGPTLYVTTSYGGSISAWDLAASGPVQINSARHTRGDVVGTEACLAFINTTQGLAVLTGGGADGALVLRDLNATGGLGTTTTLGTLTTLPGDLIATITVTLASGVQMVYGGVAGSSGVGYLTFNASGSMTGSGVAADTAATSANQVAALAEAVIGGTQYLFTAGSLDVGVTCWAVSTTGALTPVTTIDADNNLWIGTPTAMEVAVVAGQTYLVLAAAGSNTLSLIAVGANGSMTVTDHVMDDLNSRFAGATAMTVVVHGGQTYVIAGGADDGISLYQILPGGQLLALAHLADTAAMGLSDVSAIAAQSTPSGIQIFVGSSSETGLTQLTYDPGPAGQTRIAGASGGYLVGGSANDVLAGAAGGDWLQGEAGDDILMSGAGFDTLTGGAGADMFVIGAGGTTDVITDFTVGVDKIDLSDWHLIGGISDLYIEATSTGFLIALGDELLVVESSTGGPIDPALLTEADLINLTRIPVETVPLDPPPVTPTSDPPGSKGLVLQAAAIGGYLYGGTEDDILTESSGGDWLIGDGGNDILIAGAGYDTLTGGTGADVFVVTGGSTTDFITDFTLGEDIIDLSGWINLYGIEQLYIEPTATGFLIIFGYDYLVVESSAGGPIYAEWLTYADLTVSLVAPPSGAAGQSFLASSAGGYLYGGSGDDVLVEAGGGDWLIGDYGNDIVIAGAGYDTLTGGNGADTFVVTASATTDFITDFTLGIDTIDLSGWVNLYSIDQLYIEPTSNGFYILFGSELLVVESSAGGPILAEWLTPADIVISFQAPSSGAPGQSLQAGDAGGYLFGGSGNDLMTGSWGGDWLLGEYGDDVLIAGAGYDTLTGGDGADTFVVTASGSTDVITDFTLGIDRIDLTGWGVTSLDQLYIEAIANGFLIAYGDELLVVESSAGGPIYAEWLTPADLLTPYSAPAADPETAPPPLGTAGNDWVVGGSGDDLLDGLSGDDELTGNAGNDTLTGGAGRDWLTGGAGGDVFVFHSTADSGIGWEGRDVIDGFERGYDTIHLYLIDANTLVSGDQPFQFIGSATFSGLGASSAGQLRAYAADASTVLVEMDTNGDGTADMQIFVSGTNTLTAGDFIL